MESQIFLENLEIKKKAIGLIHRVYLTQLKNSRQYKASTKTNSEVESLGSRKEQVMHVPVLVVRHYGLVGE
jgi:ribosomal protein L4